jgi:DNA-binding GntR family transcriptional regulator
VAEWTAADIAEIFALRALLEPHAAAHAAARAGVEDVRELEAHCERGERAVREGEAPDLQTVSDANLAFHKAILRISGQIRTEAIVTTLYAMPIILKNFSRYDRGHLNRSLSQHRELTEAIAAGDPSWASAVMRSHVEAGKALFLDTADARGGRMSSQQRPRDRARINA